MNKEDNTTDIFIKKIVKEAGLEAPSLDFTSKVLAKVNLEKKQLDITTYKPLISQNSLVGLFVIMASIFVSFLMFGSTTTELEWIEIKMMAYINPIANAFSNISIAPTYVYGALGLLFYIYVQIYFLKRYVDKRYTAL
ncbi:hypothetical protein [Spongiimicrobium salis]|uniref:hypothetical protein n=1 Tax=Spongiimicrobium salis TaxID=1667022 RepID=UPI00374D779C